jgi:hypothetical protein
MGMFGTLMNKIFHHAGAAERPADAWVAGKPPEAAQNSAATIAVQQAAPQAVQSVDVTASLDKLAAASTEKLDWKKSIVDLMKLVGMDSSLAARRELAADLHYTGDTQDTATMNIWLHQQVMDKMAANGGNVPADLLSH